MPIFVFKYKDLSFRTSYAFHDLKGLHDMGFAVSSVKNGPGWFQDGIIVAPALVLRVNQIQLTVA